MTRYGLAFAGLLGLCSWDVRDAAAEAPLAVGHPSFFSPQVHPIAIGGPHVYVVNTPADTLDVIERDSQKIVSRVAVGIDPVSVAVRPDGREVWVSNHVSDSVSVIDVVPSSPTYLRVVATVQQFDRARATRFDEPVGIAFAGNDKAYVALSSENAIAVVDVATRTVTKRLSIPAQDPRAILVRNDRLFVLPFESNNKTQLSGGVGKLDGKLKTFDAWQHSIAVNNVLSIGHVVDIVKHPDVPDRDLFVFDTRTDELVTTVDTVGTLLYGMTVDADGRVFVAQTDARNDANGRAGTAKHTLRQLGNRAFLNRITRVDFDRDEPAEPTFLDLEPLPPAQPKREEALATPYAIEVGNDGTLFVTAAGSDVLFSLDGETGEILGRARVGAIPRGIAIAPVVGRGPMFAWVLNAGDNTVTVVDISDPKDIREIRSFELEDPTHPVVKRGRIAFETASASTTGTFSCASCHPDGHTDQLLWVLKTPIVSGGDQIMPRSTMPLRGLRDTAPFHWDGIPGDPYGGNNSANVHGTDPPNSRLDDPVSSTRHLIDGGLASTMHLDGDATVNDEGKSGRLSAAQRDALARFLLSVPYPPAQRRSYTNELSQSARAGFELFHVSGDNDPTKRRPNVCGNCHRMPFLVSTNTPGTGMDAPTWRGAYDRFLILPQGRLNIIDFDFYRRVAERGIPERDVWQFSWAGRPRFDPVWNMVVEGSTGWSGSFGRQVTLNHRSVADERTTDLLSALEQSSREGAIVLESDGVLLLGGKSEPVVLQFDGSKYVRRDGDRRAFTRSELLDHTERGEFVGTFTGRHGVHDDVEHPQPALWTPGPIERQRGRQKFPILHEGRTVMTVSGRHVADGAHVILDGRRVEGNVRNEDGERVVIELDTLPEAGLHLLQVQNPGGLFSNEFIVHVAADSDAALALQQRIDAPHVGRRSSLHEAVSRGDLKAIRRLLDDGAKINAHNREGSTPLSEAALRGRVAAARLLIDRGAKVDVSNRDGNTPLHVAAFLCRSDVVDLLLEQEASVTAKNGRGETPLDVVSGDWSEGLGAFYTGIGDAIGMNVDLDRIRSERPKMVERLKKVAVE